MDMQNYRSATEIRIIYDCSRPHGQAVNDYITTRSFKFQWDDAIKLIRSNYVMAKKDLKHAYRSIPIRLQIVRQPAANGVLWGTTTTRFSMTLAFHLGPKVRRKFSTASLKQCRVWPGEVSLT